MSTNRINTLISIMCEILQIELEDLKGRSRKAAIVEKRYMIYVAMYEHMKLRVTEIGKIVDRNHATILHGIEKMQAERKLYPEVGRKYDAFLTTVKETALPDIFMQAATTAI